MSTYEANQCQNPCEFVVPIKLTIPMEIEPKLTIKVPMALPKQKVPVHLQPSIYLEPDVLAMPTECYATNGCEQEALPAEYITSPSSN